MLSIHINNKKTKDNNNNNVKYNEMKHKMKMMTINVIIK